MSGAKHTPGPWKVFGGNGRGDEGSSEVWTEGWRTSKFIATVRYHGCDYNSDDEPDANARLIAAAPDLLEACKRALPYLRDHVCMTPDQGPGDRIALDNLEAAIAKAEGLTTPS